MRIAFHDSHIGIRGTSVAMYDYADFNEKILGNTSIVIIPEHNPDLQSTFSPYLRDTMENLGIEITSEKRKDQNDPLGVEKFTSRFPVFRYKTIPELETILADQKCDVLYCIKYGHKDEVVSKTVKTVIHCVFDMTQPHGDVYAGVSEALACKYKQTLFVPHMISMRPAKTKDNMRAELGIPESAIVFGRYGGYETMDLEFCWRTIAMVVQNFPHIYFLFANTPKILIHKNIKHVPKMIKEDDKNRFIQTCDAHLECGKMGHSFGLAIGEFSVNNKPIIAYNGGNVSYKDGKSLWNDSHLKILGSKGIYFSNEKEFFYILTTFDPSEYQGQDLNCYRDYSPEKVMEKFKQVFL